MKMDAPDHPKMYDLADLLQVPHLLAVGIIESLLCLTGRHEAVRAGNIGVWRNRAIAKRIHWEGDPDHLIRCLIETGWLDEDKAEHRLLIHDWAEHCPGWIKGLFGKKGLKFAIPGTPLAPLLRKKRLKNQDLNLNPRPAPMGSPTRTPTPTPTGSPTSVPRGTSDGDTGETEPFEDIIGPPSEPVSNPYELPPDAPQSPKTNEALPEVLRTDGFREAWRRWAVHRREIRKKLTPSTTKGQLAKLAKWGEAVAIASIGESIANGWTGLFEPKENHHGKPRNDSPARIHGNASRYAVRGTVVGETPNAD